MQKAVIILQSFCLLFTGSGITLEAVAGHQIGPLLIAAGSLIFAISVKLNKTHLIRENKRLRNSQKNNNHGKSLDTN